MESSKRIIEIDMAKGLAIAMVFFAHTCEYTGIASNVPALSNPFHVFLEGWMMLFILVSGYTYRPRPTLKDDIVNKFKTLMLPYWYGCIVSFVFYLFAELLTGNTAPAEFWQGIASNFLGANSVNLFSDPLSIPPVIYAVMPYWYLIEVFAAYCVFSLIYRLVSKKKQAVRWCVTALLFGLCMLFNALDLQGTVAYTFAIPYSYIIILPNIFGIPAMLMLGALLREPRLFDLDSRSKKITTLIAAVSAVICILIALDYDYTYGLQGGRWGQYGVLSVPVTAIGGVTLTYLVIFVFYYAKRLNPVKTVFSYIGKNTLYILLAHCLICEIFGRIFGRWYCIFTEGFPAEAFSLPLALLIILLTAVVMIGTMEIKNRIKGSIAARKAAESSK